MKFTAEQKKFISKINCLKHEKNAVILVHNYQTPAIYEVADFVGDSLGLCIEAAKTDARMIVFCGVHFMAESAAILNPRKKVVVPYIDAGCAMADMVDISKIEKLRKMYPGAAVVTYVNSTAAVKAASDVCCTSANAIKVVRAIPNKKIIFVPDKNLAIYVASQVPEKIVIPYDGYCPVHNFVNKEYLDEVRKEHPAAKIIAHPESRDEVLKAADYVSSTSGMIDCARKNPSKDFFVLTECGMIERLKKELPGKNFYGVCNFCFDMKKNTLESVLKALENEKPVVSVEKSVANKARRAFNTMFELTE